MHGLKGYENSGTNAEKPREKNGTVKFNAPLIVAAPTYNIIDELKAEGDWLYYKSTLVLNLMIIHPKKRKSSIREYFISGTAWM